MANCYPYGRVGIELNQMSLESLEMLVNYSPDGDPWMCGETLEVITRRIALLTGKSYEDVVREVSQILKEKHEKEIAESADFIPE